MFDLSHSPHISRILSDSLQSIISILTHTHTYIYIHYIAMNRCIFHWWTNSLTEVNWLNWTNQIHQWKDIKKPELLREKKKEFSLLSAAVKELTTQNKLLLVTLLPELTGQIRLLTHFSYRWRPANFHHTINGQATQKMYLCIACRLP